MYQFPIVEVSDREELTHYYGISSLMAHALGMLLFFQIPLLSLILIIFLLRYP